MGAFGDLVRKKRREKGISVRVLSEAISKRAGANASRSNISFIETGRNLPTYGVALALAQELGIDPEKALRAAFQDRVSHYKQREKGYLEEFFGENKSVKIDVERITK